MKPLRDQLRDFWHRYEDAFTAIARQAVWFIISLLLAVIVWITATIDSDPIVQDTFRFPVTIRYANLDNDVILVNKDEIHKTARVKIRAPDSVWDRLTVDDIDVRADFQDLRSGDYILPLEASLSLPGSVVSIQPSQIVAELDIEDRKTVPVHIVLTDEPAYGFEAGAPQLALDEVTVSGPTSLVELVTEAYAELSIAGMNANLQKENVRLEARDQDQPVDNVELEPAAIAVTVPIQAREDFRTLSVQPDIRGQPPSGYNWRWEWEPETVLVTGRQTRLDSMTEVVLTEPIELWGKTESFEIMVNVLLPGGITAVDEQEITVRVTIEAIGSSRKLDEVLVGARGLLPTYEAEIAPETVTAWITGPLPTINALTNDDVRAVADLTGLEPGTHEVPLEAGVTVEGFTADQVSLVPSYVRVQIIDTEATPTPTAAPTLTATDVPTEIATPVVTEMSPTPTQTHTPTMTPE